MFRHLLPTRLIHMGFAVAIITQLFTSLVMVMPRPTSGRDGNIFFEVHEYSGLAALALALIFWVWLLVRHEGTDPGALFPWFASKRLRTVGEDFRQHVAAVRALRLPPHQGYSPLASAVHGLGLLLMSLMAVSGGVVYLSMAESGAISALGQQALSVHKLFANLAWAYLIGHASLAVLHQTLGSPVIAKMWTLRSDAPLSNDRSTVA